MNHHCVCQHCAYVIVVVLLVMLVISWPCGLMDKALVFGTKDCRFESCQGHSSSCSFGPRLRLPPGALPNEDCKLRGSISQAGQGCKKHAPVQHHGVADEGHLAVWSSGMILASGARGPGLNSQSSPCDQDRRIPARLAIGILQWLLGHDAWSCQTTRQADLAFGSWLFGLVV